MGPGPQEAPGPVGQEDLGSWEHHTEGHRDIHRGLSGDMGDSIAGRFWDSCPEETLEFLSYRNCFSFFFSCHVRPRRQPGSGPP